MCSSLFSSPKISAAPAVNYTYASTPPAPDEGADAVKTGDSRSDIVKKVDPARMGTNSLRSDLNIPGGTKAGNGLSIAGV